MEPDQLEEDQPAGLYVQLDPQEMEPDQLAGPLLYVQLDPQAMEPDQPAGLYVQLGPQAMEPDQLEEDQPAGPTVHVMPQHQTNVQTGVKKLSVAVVSDVSRFVGGSVKCPPVCV